MNWFFFIVFLLMTLALIWNGKDFYTKKQWFKTLLMLLLVLVSTAVIGFIFKYLTQFFSLFSVATAKQYSILFSMSLLCVWGLKVVVVLLCTIFDGIMAGHKAHNSQHYEKLSSVSRVVAPNLLIAAKGFISLGSVLIFSGLWLK